jgi:hypothetical protein
MFTPMYESSPNISSVDRGDVFQNACADIIADQGHQRLKKSEAASDDERFFEIEFAVGKPLADGDRERVHRKRHAQPQQFYDVHMRYSPFKKDLCAPIKRT